MVSISTKAMAVIIALKVLVPDCLRGAKVLVLVLTKDINVPLAIHRHFSILIIVRMHGR